jgi:uncharacterized protein YbjT (DUF2867 family)
MGATGLLGKPVAHALHDAGFELTALVRNKERAGRELPQGIVLIQGDLKNCEDIARTIRGCDAVYINLSVKKEEKPSDWHTESDGLRLILDEAKKSSIKRLAIISSLVQRYQGMNNFYWWAFDIKQQAIQLIKDSGIPYTIFYPSSFMENFHDNYKQGKRLVLAGNSEFKQYFIAGKDYGKQVARSFQLNLSENREYTIQGPEGFTTDEACIEFKKYYKKEKLSIVKVPLGVLKIFGAVFQKMNYGYHIIEALNKYPEKFESENTWKELSKPEITLRSFAESL